MNLRSPSADAQTATLPSPVAKRRRTLAAQAAMVENCFAIDLASDRGRGSEW